MRCQSDIQIQLLGWDRLERAVFTEPVSFRAFGGQGWDLEGGSPFKGGAGEVGMTGIGGKLRTNLQQLFPSDFSVSTAWGWC